MQEVRVLRIAALCLTLSGCAGVGLYSDNKLTTKTGIPMYAPKPYLMVTRTGAKDKPIDVSVVYLPDVSNVVYAKPRSGFGSSKTTLALTNGQLTSFGQDADAKIPELLSSINGLITARAGADKTGAEADKIRAELQSATTVETGQTIKRIADDMAAKVPSLIGLTADENGKVASAGQALLGVGITLSNPANAPQGPAQVAIAKAQAAILDKLPKATASTPRDASLTLIAAWAGEVNAAVREATPEKPPEATFELYEIIQANGTTRLRLVSP